MLKFKNTKKHKKSQNLLQLCTHFLCMTSASHNCLLRSFAMWPLSVMTSVLYRPYSTLQMAKEYPMLADAIHMVYLPTLTIKLNKMEANIPYMDPRGYNWCPLCTTRGYCLFLAESSICPARSTENLLGSDRRRR